VERRHVAKHVEDIFDQEMSGESIQKMYEEEREEGDEGWIDRFDNSRIYDEEREEYKCDEPSGSKDKWEEKGLKLEGYSLCSIEAQTIGRKYMEVLKDEEKSESTMSDLDDMWYIQDFEDEDWDDNEDLKEEINANEVDGLHITHDEMEGVQKGNKETPSLVEIDSHSTPPDEKRPRYVLKYQDIISINVDKLKYSCSTNSLNNSLNSMPCSNNDHVGRLDFLENEKRKHLCLIQLISHLKNLCLMMS
jgi:hypothetical protein